MVFRGSFRVFFVCCDGVLWSFLRVVFYGA